MPTNLAATAGETTKRRRPKLPDDNLYILVREAQSGDAAAFERLYRLHVGRVYAICLRLCVDPHPAEELTQQIFIRAWQKLPTFRGDSAFGSWLYRLAVNVVFGHIKAQRRRSSLFSLFDFSRPPQGATNVPEPGASMDLEAAIRTLPPQARAVFVLYDIEGYPHHEVAEMLGIAIGTSKAHLHRARGLLRKVLQS